MRKLKDDIALMNSIEVPGTRGDLKMHRLVDSHSIPKFQNRSRQDSKSLSPLKERSRKRCPVCRSTNVYRKICCRYCDEVVTLNDEKSKIKKIGMERIRNHPDMKAQDILDFVLHSIKLPDEQNFVDVMDAMQVVPMDVQDMQGTEEKNQKKMEKKKTQIVDCEHVVPLEVVELKKSKMKDLSLVEEYKENPTEQHLEKIVLYLKEALMSNSLSANENFEIHDIMMILLQKLEYKQAATIVYDFAAWSEIQHPEAPIQFRTMNVKSFHDDVVQQPEAPIIKKVEVNTYVCSRCGVDDQEPTGSELADPESEAKDKIEVNKVVEEPKEEKTSVVEELCFTDPIVNSVYIRVDIGDVELILDEELLLKHYKKNEKAIINTLDDNERETFFFSDKKQRDTILAMSDKERTKYFTMSHKYSQPLRDLYVCALAIKCSFLSAEETIALRSIDPCLRELQCREWSVLYPMSRYRVVTYGKPPEVQLIFPSKVLGKTKENSVFSLPPELMKLDGKRNRKELSLSTKQLHLFILQIYWGKLNDTENLTMVEFTIKYMQKKFGKGESFLGRMAGLLRALQNMYTKDAWTLQFCRMCSFLYPIHKNCVNIYLSALKSISFMSIPASMMKQYTFETSVSFIYPIAKTQAEIALESLCNDNDIPFDRYKPKLLDCTRIGILSQKQGLVELLESKPLAPQIQVIEIGEFMSIVLQIWELKLKIIEYQLRILFISNDKANSRILTYQQFMLLAKSQYSYTPEDGKKLRSFFHLHSEKGHLTLSHFIYHVATGNHYNFMFITQTRFHHSPILSHFPTKVQIQHGPNSRSQGNHSFLQVPLSPVNPFIPCFSTTL